MHYYRWYRTGTTDPEPPRDISSYQSAHARVSRRRGRASNYRCVDCAGPAREWSYQGGSSLERVGPNYMRDRVGECAYSPDPMDYAPRCIRCHRAHDRSVAS